MVSRNQELFEEIIIPICNHILLPQDGYVGDCNVQDLSSEDWKQMLTIASLHGMLPVVMRYLDSMQIKDKQLRLLILKYYAQAQGNQTRLEQRLEVMNELSRIVGSAGMDIMFFKGASLAQLYPNPEMRVFNDVDYYLYGDSAKGIEEMSRHGIINEASYHHHTKAVFKGVLLENHYDFLERENHKSDIVADDMLKQMALEEGKMVKASFLDDDVRNAYVMTPTMNALFLMRHMLSHFASETIPIKMMYDWSLFLLNEGKKVDWNRVLSFYEKSGTSKFASIIMEILSTYMKIEVPDCQIPMYKGKETRKVWESIVNPPEVNPYPKFSFRFFVVEARVFIENRWKFKIAYPGESYFLLSLHYTWLIIKRKLGLLKVKEG